jgi:serine/threonine protein kinase
MTMSKTKAAAKKMLFLNNINSNNKNSDDSDGSISSDDVEQLETDYLGHIVEEQYIIIKYLGKGTFSKVWLVYDLINNNYITFKMFFSEDKDEYENELEVLDVIKSNNMDLNLNYKGALCHTFNINNEHIDTYILLMPYLGISIADILDDKLTLSINEIKHITKQLLMSLIELHNCKYIHCDLKTDNILTNIYKEENTDYINWFSSLTINNIYDDIIKTNSPTNDEFLKLDKNKRKFLKRKIKKRSLKELHLYVKKKCLNYDIESLNLKTIDLNLANTTNTDKNMNVNTCNDNNIKFNMMELNEINLDNDALLNDKDMCMFDNLLDVKLTLIDYSNSIHIDEIDNDDEYQIRAYRSPENILGINYNYKSELWAVGCIIWGFLTDEYIFEPKLVGSNISRDRAQLSLMETYLGKLSSTITSNSNRYNELFDNSGKIKKHNNIKRETLENNLKNIRSDLSNDEISDICSLLRKIWIYNPKARLNINQILNDDFFNK